jgi:hypothetical protein
MVLPSSNDVIDFQKTEISYENLVARSEIDEITSLTIPVVVELFETIDIVHIQDKLLETAVPENFNEILGEAVKLGNALLKEVTIKGNPNIADNFKHNLYDKTKIQAILAGSNPYYYQMVQILASKGALGDLGNGKVVNAIQKMMTSIFPNGVSSNEISNILEMTMSELVQSSGGDLGGLVNLSKFTGNSLFQLPVANVEGIVGQKIVLGEKGTTSTIDLTEQLAPDNERPTSPEHWKVFGIGAGKDLIVKGNVTFKNANRHSRTNNLVKDHALAIGALDDLHFHSETWEKDWQLPAGFLQEHIDDVYVAAKGNIDERITLDFEGANLYLGAVSKVELVNVDLKSGGNLGVGSLDELHIVSLDPKQSNVFTVGQNTNPLEGAKVQLYANERIVADGLAFGGRADEIYMEARTVDLRNVEFPSGSEIKLVSQLGGIDGRYPTFGLGERQMGRVNFIQDVYYDTKHIYNPNSFDALAPLPNGKQPITILKKK